MVVCFLILIRASFVDILRRGECKTRMNLASLIRLAVLAKYNYNFGLALICPSFSPPPAPRKTIIDTSLYSVDEFVLVIGKPYYEFVPSEFYFLNGEVCSPTQDLCSLEKIEHCHAADIGRRFILGYLFIVDPLPKCHRFFVLAKFTEYSNPSSGFYCLHTSVHTVIYGGFMVLTTPLFLCAVPDP